MGGRTGSLTGSGDLTEHSREVPPDRHPELIFRRNIPAHPHTHRFGLTAGEHPAEGTIDYPGTCTVEAVQEAGENTREKEEEHD